MKQGLNNLIVIFLYLLFSYPLFYYAYKFGSPDFGHSDFYSYYHLYKNWDFENVASPFNTRLISSFLIFLFSKLGFFYDAQISYSHPGIDQKVFFNAIFVNYLSLVMTAFVIYHTIKTFFSNELLAFLTGMISFLGFGALFYSLNTLTESFSVLLFALIFFFYQSRSYWIIPLLALTIIQREYIFFVTGLISLIHYFVDKKEKGYFASVFICSVIGFMIYYLLRKTIFFTPHFSSQLTPDVMENLLNPVVPLGEYLRQSFLNQNLLLLYLFILLFKIYRQIKIDKLNLVIVFLLYFQVHLISIVAVPGNNAGRYFYIIFPLILFYSIKEIIPFVSTYVSQITINDV